MTPKEKAKELVNAFLKHSKVEKEFRDVFHAKQCALIAVDECLHTCVESMVYFWQEVKNEIEKL